jgi:hypothetical protein
LQKGFDVRKMPFGIKRSDSTQQRCHQFIVHCEGSTIHFDAASNSLMPPTELIKLLAS